MAAVAERAKDYQDLLSYMRGLQKMGIRLDLGPVKSLLERLGNPHLDYPAVLIAGTNGKGSVAAMTASILSAAGWRTGLYTSPDLVDLRERIRIDGKLITLHELLRCGRSVREAATEAVSYFEFLTAAAFLHFSLRRVDIAVLEVGMGGRLDATNVVDPLVSVVTTISLEHRQYLGNTLAAIAAEKGGIIREGGTCLTGARQRQVLATLEGICRQRRAAFLRVGSHIRTVRRPDGTFSYFGLRRRLKGLVCPLAGGHQLVNAALALGTVELLAEKGLPVGEREMAEGLATTTWEGRLEVLQRHPLVLLDGAHNPAGAATLRRALGRDFSFRRLVLVFGVLEDKAYAAMARLLLPLADRVILTQPSSERSLPLPRLMEVARRYHPRPEGVGEPAAALARALAAAEAEDLICVAGSLYLVGEIKRLWPSAKEAP